MVSGAFTNGMISIVFKGSRIVQTYYCRGTKVLTSITLLASCTKSVNDKLNKISLLCKLCLESIHFEESTGSTYAWVWNVQ